MLLVEAAFSKLQRNNFVPLAQFNLIAKEVQQRKGTLYRSVFMYPEEELRQHLMARNGRIKGYTGNIYPGHIPLDVDGEGHTMKGLTKRVNALTSKLHDGIGIPPEYVQYFWSGRGVHAMIHKDLFKLTPSHVAHRSMRRMLRELLMGEVVFDFVYANSQIFRWPNTVNESSGLFKIPITYQEVREFNHEYLNEQAKTQRLDFDFSRFNDASPDPTLMSYARDAEADIMAEENASGILARPLDKTMDPIQLNRKKLTCIHGIVDRGPAEGGRHYDIGAISCAWSRQGIPMVVTKHFLSAWIRQGDNVLPDNTTKYTNEYVHEQVEHWYRGGYRPSCTGDNPFSQAMQRHCDSECIFFKRKDINSGALNADESFERLKKRMKQENDGNYINMTQILAPGDEGPQLKIFPGTVMTIMGPTTIGKTSFVTWFLLRMRRACILYSMEMATSAMMRRLALQVLLCGEKELPKMFQRHEDTIKEATRHITIAEHAPSTDEVEAMMANLGINICVLDHIGLMKSPHSDPRRKTLQITNELRQLSVRREYLVIQVSHIQRNDAREGDVTLFSGKESGSIENDSHIVLGFRTHKTYPDLRVVEVLKNTDGPKDMQYQLLCDFDSYTFTPLNIPR